MEKRFEKCVVLVVLVNIASIDEDSVFCRTGVKVAKRAENSLFYELSKFFLPNLRDSRTRDGRPTCYCCGNKGHWLANCVLCIVTPLPLIAPGVLS